jgi:hypothetical protein
VGLIKSSMVCCKCGSQISWCFNTNLNDGYRWPCRRKTYDSVCSASMSFFRHSTLSCMDVLFLIYDITSLVPAHTILQGHHFGSATATDWGIVCREVILDYVLASSQKNRRSLQDHCSACSENIPSSHSGQNYRYVDGYP